MVFYGLKKIFITDQEDRAYTRLGFCVRDLGFGIRDPSFGAEALDFSVGFSAWVLGSQIRAL